VDDFQEFGGMVGENRTLTQNAYNEIPLSSTDAVDTTGMTKLAVLGSLDYDDEPPVSQYNSFNLYYSNYSGTARDPYLDIEVQQGGTLSIPVAMHHYNLLRSA
jgi:hypothetical protein